MHCDYNTFYHSYATTIFRITFRHSLLLYYSISFIIRYVSVNFFLILRLQMLLEFLYTNRYTYLFNMCEKKFVMKYFFFFFLLYLLTSLLSIIFLYIFSALFNVFEKKKTKKRNTYRFFSLYFCSQIYVNIYVKIVRSISFFFVTSSFLSLLSRLLS